MANQGIYREGGGGGGLPLPRAHLLAFTVGVCALALGAVVLSPALLALLGGSAAGAWRIFRNGGVAMYSLVALNLLAPVVIAGLGAFVLRGKRAPAGLLFVLASLPFALALLGAWMGQRQVMRALSGGSIDPEQSARILAEGIAETMAADMFGGFVACGAALAAAFASAAAVASIDVGTAARGGARPAATGALGAGVAGGLWLVATLGLGAARMRAAGGVAFLPALPLLVLVPSAVLAGRASSVLRGWHDRGEASRVAGALLVAALAALLAVLALQRAVESSFASKALEAIAGETVDESQRARILVYALDAGRLASAAYALHFALGAATFGLALAPALGNARNPATPSVVIAAVVGLLLIACTASLARSRNAAPHAMAARATDPSPAGVTLPVVVDAFSHKGAGAGYEGARLVLRRDGTGDGTIDSGCAQPKLTVYADRAATVASLRARLGAPSDSSPCPRRLTFVAKRAHPPELEARLGELTGYLGTTAYFTATLDDDRTAGPARPYDLVMRVTSVSDDTLEIDGARVTLPLVGGASPGGPGATRVRYLFRPTDTIGHVLDTIVAVETAYASHLSTWELERSIDDGARPPPPPPTTDEHGITVAGRLPPEVIERIVRKDRGHVRACYEAGLFRNPTLHGRVVVKFVIGRSGAVTSATDDGSDLPDRGVVACVLSAFSRLSFPQPEAGVVTVTYAVVLAPE